MKKLKNGYPEYSGELASPIDPWPVLHKVQTGLHGLDSKEIEKANFIQAMREAQDAKIELLLKHFGISQDREDKWETLAYQLARAHVPGLDIVETPPHERKRRGRPSDWTNTRYLQLYKSVEERVEKQGKSRRSICFNLAKSKRWGSSSGKALYRRYWEAKKIYEKEKFVRDFFSSGLGAVLRKGLAQKKKN